MSLNVLQHKDQKSHSEPGRQNIVNMPVCVHHENMPI